MVEHISDRGTRKGWDRRMAKSAGDTQQDPVSQNK